MFNARAWFLLQAEAGGSEVGALGVGHGGRLEVFEMCVPEESPNAFEAVDAAEEQQPQGDGCQGPGERE